MSEIEQRFYASTLGRFLTPDPYKASAGPESPASWNRYTYVEDDPINFNDPLGLAKGAIDDPGVIIRVDVFAPKPPGEIIGDIFDWLTRPRGDRANDRQVQSQTNIFEDQLEGAYAQILDLAGDNAGTINTFMGCMMNSFMQHYGLSGAAGASGLL